MFNPNGINFYKSVLQREVNDLLLKRLLGHSRWNIVTSRMPIDIFQKAYGGTDAGSIICSYRDKTSNSVRVESEWIFIDDDFKDPHMDDLNFYAELIYMLVLNRTVKVNGVATSAAFRNLKVKRYFWNYYHSNSIGLEHTDILDPNHWSIIYYLNDNPGTGTRIITPEGEEIISPHVAGDAVMFPSHWVHNGISPKGSSYRTCLNILFQADLI